MILVRKLIDEMRSRKGVCVNYCLKLNRSLESIHSKQRHNAMQVNRNSNFAHSRTRTIFHIYMFNCESTNDLELDRI